MDSIKIYRLRDVKMPQRGTSEAAGVDFFVPSYNPEFLDDFVHMNKGRKVIFNFSDTGEFSFSIAPHERIVIPSGVCVCIPKGTMLNASNKSGVAIKKGLRYTAHVVDSDFAGEIGIGIENTTDNYVSVSEGEKIIQFVHTPVLLDPVEEIEQSEFTEFHSKSERGSGWQGSTGTK